jgi:hypothetical protein
MRRGILLVGDLLVEHGRDHTKYLKGCGFAALLTACFALAVGLGIGGDTAALHVDDIATALAALAASVLCARAGLHQARNMRAFWWLLAGAAGAWALGETIWGVYDLVLVEEVPVPSWADIGYLGGIPLAVAALLSHPAVRGRSSLTARSALDALVLATALLFMSWTFVFEPLWQSDGLTTAGRITALAYPFGDVVIMFCIVLAVRRMPRGERIGLWFLLGGLLAMALADSTYAYLSGVQGYEPGNLFDLGWFIAYLGIALGAFLSDQPEVVPDMQRSPLPTLGQLVAPFAPVLVALSVMAHEVKFGDRIDGDSIVIALALIVMVLVRQGLFLLDALRPERDEAGVTSRLEHAAFAGVVSDE